MHSHKLLHLDLKPSNIYMRNDYTPVLIDFGAARQTLANDTPMLKPMYTPGFASPEHYTQRELLGPWSDIYSVGASMYALSPAPRRRPADNRLEGSPDSGDGALGRPVLGPAARNDRLVPMPEPHVPSAKRLRAAEGTDRKVTKPEGPAENWLTRSSGKFKERVTPSEIHHLSGKPYRQRANNEDRLAHCYSRDALLMVIADGMGGHYYGEIAAQIAVQTLTESFQREATPTDRRSLHVPAEGDDQRHHAIRFHRAHKPARLAAHDLRRLPDPEQRRLLGAFRRFAPLSDARRTGRAAHARSLAVQLLIDQGIISEGAGGDASRRNKIYSCLGGSQPPDIEFSRKTPLEAGDVLAVHRRPVGRHPESPGSPGCKGEPDPGACPALNSGRRARRPNADNLSMSPCAGRTATSSSPGLSSVISTQTMARDTVTTRLDAFGRKRRRIQDGTQRRRDRTRIEEIRSTIQKFSK